MTLDEFIQNEFRLLKKFQQYWLGARIKNDANDFPYSMEQQEWIEQFDVWNRNK